MAYKIEDKADYALSIFDVGFTENKTLAEIPKHRIEAFKEAIAKGYLEEITQADIDNGCYWLSVGQIAITQKGIERLLKISKRDNTEV